MVTGSPDRMADGSKTNANAANAYAHHIVPTPEVILTASAAFTRSYQGAWGSEVMTSTTLGGPACRRAAIRGCGTYLKMSDMGRASHHGREHRHHLGGRLSFVGPSWQHAAGNHTPE